MIRRRALVVCVLCAGAAAAQDPTIDAAVRAVLTTHLRFSEGDLASLGRGQVAKHDMPSRAPGEIAVAGAVRIRAPKAKFFARVRDIARFKSGPAVLQIGRFSNPAITNAKHNCGTVDNTNNPTVFPIAFQKSGSPTNRE